MRVVMIALLVLSFWSCNPKSDVDTKKVIRPVRVSEVSMGGGNRVRTFSGSARASKESKLSFRVGGKLKELNIKLGDRVKKGQQIGLLDGRDYELQVQQAEAGLRQATAQERNAKASYERTRGLYESNNASINDLDTARAGKESAAAQVSSLSKQLELAKSQLSYTKLLAPLDGSIARVLAEANENVGAGQAIAILNAGSRSDVRFQVPEQLISQIREGDTVSVNFDALPGDEFKATITEVGIATGGIEMAFPVTVSLEEADDRIRQGMAAEVFVTFGRASDTERIFVKPKAVVEDSEGRFVYIATPDDPPPLATVHRRKVETGVLTEDGLEIITGLKPGDLLVIAGVRFLTEGLVVRLPEKVER